ncbi:hypothetical protein ACS0TY_015971 [Phlomoides rotata]
MASYLFYVIHREGFGPCLGNLLLVNHLEQGSDKIKTIYYKSRKNMRCFTRENMEILMYVMAIMRRNVLLLAFSFAFIWMHRLRCSWNYNRRRFSLVDRIPDQVRNLRDLVEVSDDDCKNMLRMDRGAFNRFCHILISVGGLKNSKHVVAREKVAMFLYILAHHTKNRAIKFQFKRSGQTVSKYFHMVLRSVLKLHSLFLVKPEPIPEDSTDPRWGKFKVLIMEVGGMENEKVKASRGRRSWIRAEEEALIQCLTTIVNEGWKADNMFKAGFQQELEKGM